MPLENSALQHVIHPKLPAALQALTGSTFGRLTAFGQSVTFRGLRAGIETVVDEQKVRITSGGAGRSSGRNSAGANQDELAVFVIGAPGLDVEVEDRFNDDAGNLYEVSFIRPNRQVQTTAEARLVE